MQLCCILFVFVLQELPYLYSTDFVPETISKIEKHSACINLNRNHDKQTITLKNNKLPVLTWGPNNVEIGNAYKNRININNNTINELEFCILNASKDDAGTYEWEDFKGKKHYIQLNVWYPAEIDSMVIEDKNVKEFSDINITCRVDSYPMSNITLYKNDKMLNTTSRRENEIVFELNNTTCEDSGLYECSAFNGIGKSDTKYITLDVLCKPIISGSPTGHEKEERITASFGDRIVMNFSIAANPSPVVMLNSSNSNVTLSHISDYLYCITMTLKISSVFDFRQYFLIIRNSEGNVTIAIKVEEKKRNLVSGYGYIIGIPVTLMILLTVFVLIYTMIKRTKYRRDIHQQSDAAQSDDPGGYTDNISYLSIDSDLFQAQTSDSNFQNFDADFTLNECSEEKGIVYRNTTNQSVKAETEEAPVNAMPDPDNITTKGGDNIKKRKPIPRPRESKMRTQSPDKVKQARKQKTSNFGI